MNEAAEKKEENTSVCADGFLFFKTDKEKQLAEFIEPILNSHACKLVSLKLSSQNNKSFLLLLVDVLEGAIQLEKLTFVNRLLSDALDVEEAKQNWFDKAYELEVSSPGVERPLCKPSHFKASLGKKIRVRLNKANAIEKKRNLNGELLSVSKDGLVLKEESFQKELNVVWQDIQEANLVFEFGMKRKQRGA